MLLITVGSYRVLCAMLVSILHMASLNALNVTDPLARTSIQKSYDLTKYLEHQLRSLAGPYLNYLGPPFNDPDFNPPRAGGPETIPSASVDFHMWRNLNDGLRLAENHRAYSLLLCYLRSIDGEVARAELRRSLGRFCTSLQGLVVSIAGVMSSLGYQPPQELATSSPLPAMGYGRGNDFLRKMEDFWLLKELQIWLWRSAKDFNRLKRKVPAVVSLRVESRGY
ncbi:cardiotrophin-like cytokine factor 1 [Spea bombifrons]|uniref:cardiotrophin-like cytokine factor 1 n=1 Tax=Spea bombifrons TaxID=233779 RepID=UPI002349A221|nr:cardiotrophin-like cytokine factor 1 [Spea bombifrons]